MLLELEDRSGTSPLKNMNRTSHIAFNPMSPTSVLHKGHSAPSAGRGSRLYVAESSSIMSQRGALGCRSHSSDSWCLISCDVSSCWWGGSSGQRWYCMILHTTWWRDCCIPLTPLGSFLNSECFSMSNNLRLSPMAWKRLFNCPCSPFLSDLPPPPPPQLVPSANQPPCLSLSLGCSIPLTCLCSFGVRSIRHAELCSTQLNFKKKEKVKRRRDDTGWRRLSRLKYFIRLRCHV